MNNKTLLQAEKDAKEFIKRIKTLKERLKTDPTYTFYGCNETSSVKRQSLELTKSLTQLRKSS